MLVLLFEQLHVFAYKKQRSVSSKTSQGTWKVCAASDDGRKRSRESGAGAAAAGRSDPGPAPAGPGSAALVTLEKSVF